MITFEHISTRLQLIDIEALGNLKLFIFKDQPISISNPDATEILTIRHHLDISSKSYDTFNAKYHESFK